MRKSEDKETWSVKTAARLRAVHASFGDKSADDRRVYLEDEVEYALDEAEGLPGENRESLLKALELWFPVYGEEVEAVSRPAEKSAEEVVVGVDELIFALEGKRSSLGQAQLRKLADLLEECGGTGAEAVSGVPAALEQRMHFPEEGPELEDCVRGIDTVCRSLGWAEGEQPQLKLSRLVKLLGILVDSFGGLYPFAWQFWQGMVPRELGGNLAQSFTQPLEEVVAEYLAGGDVSSRDFYREVERTKKVIVGMLYSAHQGGLEYGKFCERRFSPDAIVDAVMLEETATDPKKIRDLGRKCWDKYSQLGRNRTAEAMHEEFLRILAETVLTYVKKQA